MSRYSETPGSCDGFFAICSPNQAQMFSACDKQIVTH